MIKFINNIGEYFASNYFDEDFAKKVIEKSGYSRDALKEFQSGINALKNDYFALKQKFVENHLRVKDRVNLSHRFHTQVLKALGYDSAKTDYDNLYPINDDAVLPVRHILYRGDRPHMMIMEMHALIKTGEEEPDGLFEQSYHVEENEAPRTQGEQKYHRSQWADIFNVPEGARISPMVINQAVGQLFLLPEHRRPKYILLCAGNRYFLLESEKWFRGSYLELDLEILFDESVANRDYLTLFYLLLGKDLLAPTADVVLMEQLDEESHKAAYEVTKDLKEGVIHAVEQIANEAVYYLTTYKGYTYSDIDASKLKDDCLTMVYRLLFLFYAESREELDILPSNDSVYNRGYSLEMLRDLEQVPMQTESSRNGHFFHESIYKLFDLLNQGYSESNGLNKTFRIRHLDSPLFTADSLHYLGGVKIRNYVWQGVIIELSLSKQQRNRNRGRISYANLGINQLGSVYESLLAFRGFMAETDYIEVHKKRSASETSEEVVRKEGSFLVPRHRLDDFDIKEVYHDVEGDDEVMRIISEGTFIYRLSGRDRQKSASYYTPEVLTQTTVKYTLKPILEKLERGKIKALDLLNLKILEPAMGAAAFHNEAINQIAEAYLLYRQAELGRKVEPNKYREELQKIKAYIALNNVYGVDIDPTAIELGKLSLWLNVIHKDMQTPFFGYRLGVGNAVIGSWLKVYKHRQFSFEPVGRGHKTKKWWEEAPEHLKFGKKGILRRQDEIYHFLLPDANMASSASIKLLKDEYQAESKRVTEWKKEFTAPIRADEYKLLQKISGAIDKLLLEHYELQNNIALLTQGYSDFFGNEEQNTQTSIDRFNYGQKETLAKKRFQDNAPYYKLKMIMDYWCALWFWDVRDAADLPTRREWYEDLMRIINIDFGEDNPEIDSVEEEAETYLRNYRKDRREREKQIAEQLRESTSSLFENERADRVKKYAKQYKFFHYELEFIEVFRENNGFDLAVGNPPWLKITFEEKGVMAEIFPELLIRKISAAQVRGLRDNFMTIESQRKLYLEENIENDVSSTFMNAYQNYPLLKGQQTNLYRCVIENGFEWIAERGIMGLIHQDAIYDDVAAVELRAEIYNRLIYRFQFQNAFNLFADVAHRTKYSINIYRGNKSTPMFYNINNVFHPSTIDLCFTNKSIEIEEGIKIKDQEGRYKWNINGNCYRIIEYNQKSIELLARFSNSNPIGPKLISIHNTRLLSVIENLSVIKQRLLDFNRKITEGWHETNDVKKSRILKKTFYPLNSIELIYSGPQFYVANPFYKNPKKECTDKSHYDVIDLCMIKEDFLPRSNFKLNGLNKHEDVLNSKLWHENHKILVPSLLNQSGERTYQACLIPKGSTHIQASTSIVIENEKSMILFLGLSQSIVFDFIIKTLSIAKISQDVLDNLPFPSLSDNIANSILSRTMLLNCLTNNYSYLWNCLYVEDFKEDSWSIVDSRLKPFESLDNKWKQSTPLRNYFERRQALVEIDVITAMALGISLDELILMYNIQFPVLQQNEDDTWYDTKGNIVFTVSKGLVGVGLDRPDWNLIQDMQAGETYEHTITKSELYYGDKVTYYAPFTKQDRVEDYRRAWAFFEERFK